MPERDDQVARRGRGPRAAWAPRQERGVRRAAQQRRLTDAVFRWEGADEAAHFIIANEVADALPVHRVIMRQGQLRELHVKSTAAKE